MTYANLYEGAEWPSMLSKDDNLTNFMYSVDADMAGSKHWHSLPGSIEQAEEFTSGWGITGPRHQQQYMATSLFGLQRRQKEGVIHWQPRRLWIKVEDAASGGEGKTDRLFYARKHEYKGILRFRADRIAYDEYIHFKAKTVLAFQLWTGVQNPSGGSGPPSWNRSGPQRTGRTPVGEAVDDYQVAPLPEGAVGPMGPLQNGPTPAASASRTPFEEHYGDDSRFISKFEQERADMQAIANGIVRDQPPGLSARGAMSAEISLALIAAGYTPSQVAWFHDGGLSNPLADGLGLFQIDGSAAKRAGADSSQSGEIAKITPPTPAVTKLVVRAPLGYTKPAGSGGSNGEMRPHIAQVGSYLTEPDRYFFRQIPNMVSYQGLGSRWVEIPRKGDFPIVEWSDWALMKVSFDFLIAHDMDGLFADVATDIDQLRRMAQRPLPVSVYGMDQLFSLQMKRAMSTGKSMQFVIANFTVKSARRTVLEGNKEITAAQCSMTLQEIPIEEMMVVEMTMPPLTGTSLPTPPAGEDDGGHPIVSGEPAFHQHAANLLQTNNEYVEPSGVS